MAAPLAGGSGASCCVARRASGVLWVSPVSVRRRLWGGEGVCACGAGLWVMSHRRMPSRRASWRVSRRRLRTYGWSWGAGRLRGWTPFRHPHSEQRRPARAHAVGPVLGPHARIDRTRDTRVAEPWLHAPEDERPGKGQRLTPGAPHNGGRHPPRGRPSATPTASNAGPQGRTLWGRCWVHTPASTAPRTLGSRNPGCTLRRTSGRGRDSA